MSFFNPYDKHGANLENAPKLILEITPSDTDDLPRACKALRIYNPTAAAVTVHITTVGGSDVTLDIPASTLWIEEAVVQKVHETGTSVGITIHGYSD